MPTTPLEVFPATCPMCFPGATNYGELVKGFYLAEHRGQLFICNSNGHDKLFLLVGKVTPRPFADKWEDDNYIATAEERAALDAWDDDVLNSFTIDIEWDRSQAISLYFALADACRASGYIRTSEMNDDPRFWLYERAVKLVETKRGES